MADVSELTVRIALSGEDFGSAEERERIVAVEDELIAALEGAGVGSVDGDAFGEGEALLFLLGPDAARLEAVVVDVLVSSKLPAGSWHLSRPGTADDEVEPAMALAPVVFSPTAVPPGWGEQSWFELCVEQDGLERRAMFRIEPLERVRPGASLRRDAAVASPIVSCSEPMAWPSRHWDAWVVHAVHESYFSLFLPDWLLDAPSCWMVSLRYARQQLDALDVDVRAQRRADQNLLSRPTTFVEEVAALDTASGSIEWWIDDRPSDTTPFSSGPMLIELLQAEANSSTPRQHLIAGLHDAARFAVWNSAELP